MEINRLGIELQGLATPQKGSQTSVKPTAGNIEMQQAVGENASKNLINEGVKSEDFRSRNAEREKASSEQADTINSKPQKAHFAVVGDDDVVIRIVDSDGNVVRQIPPDEYIRMMDTIESQSESLFHTVA